MAEEIIRIRVTDAEKSQEKVEALRRALADLDIEIESVTESTGEVASESESFGDKAKGLGIKIAEVAAVHKAYEVAQRRILQGTAPLISASASLTAAIEGVTAKVTAARASMAGLARGAMAALRIGIVGLVAAISTKLVIAFGKWLDRMGAAGAALAVTRQGVDNLARSIGETAETIENRLRRATLGTVDDFTLLKGATFALQTEIFESGRQMEEAAELTTILALAAGKEAAEGFNLFTQAVARNSIPLLKQLGLVVDTQEAHEEFAVAVGKTVEELSEQEKITARLEAAMEKARENVHRLNLETDNLAVVNAQAVAAQQNLTLAFQREVAESEELVFFKRELLGLTTDLRTEMEKFAPVLGAVTDTFFRLAQSALPGATREMELFQRELDRIRVLQEEGIDIPIGQRIRRRLSDELREIADQAIRAREALSTLQFDMAPPAPDFTIVDPALRRRFGQPVQGPPRQAGPAVPPAPPTLERLGLDVGIQFGAAGRAEAAMEVLRRQTDELDPLIAGLNDRLATNAARWAEVGDAVPSDEELRAIAMEFVGFGLNLEQMIARLDEMGITSEDTRMEILRLVGAMDEELVPEVEKLNQRWSAAIEGAVAATIEGGNQLQIAFGGLMQALVAEVRRAAGGGVLGGLLGGLVGGFGALISQSFSGGDRDNRPVPVTVTNRVRIDRSDERDQTVVINLTDPVTGEVIESFVAASERMRSRGGTVRIPRPREFSQSARP